MHSSLTFIEPGSGCIWLNQHLRYIKTVQYCGERPMRPARSAGHVITPGYMRHQPEKMLLYPLVEQHYAVFKQCSSSVQISYGRTGQAFTVLRLTGI
jgi:hypothetical protein